ncbi:MAG: ParB family chromosome partitioning protein [Chlorobi bacterium OLB5]|nr:MAG: ParB family chromosome partitioning protein [Chlorobi bacterium OLB5]
MSKDKIKGGLGKGLDVLFGGNDSESRNTSPENITEMNPVHSDENILFIELGKINSNPYQPRKEFDDSELKDLAASIKQKGVIQAITVRKLENGNFELISGERRLRASKLAGIEKIPAYIIDVSTKEDLLEIALIENIQRSDLNAIEVAEAYKRLIDECSLKQDDVAFKVGKSRSAVTNTLRLLTLPDEIKHSIKKGEISEGHARTILALDTDVERLLLWKRITQESLSVRKTEELAKKKKSKAGGREKKIYEITDQNKAAIKFLEEKFMEHFGTRVRLSPSSPTTGSIVIEYYTAEDLERIIDLCKK